MTDREARAAYWIVLALLAIFLVVGITLDAH